MLLKTRTIRHQPKDAGSALIAVIGVAAILMILGVSLATVTTHSLGTTTSTRAGTQSVAAAESGVNAAIVALRGGTCSATYASTATIPGFGYAISYSLSATDNSWVNGCPASSVQAKRVKVTSTGHASAKGVAGSTAGDKSIVEATFTYIPAVLPGVPSTGAAIYMYGGVVFANNGNLVVSQSGTAAIQIKNGSLSCSNNTVIQGDVTVLGGDLDINACTIRGNAWTSGAASLGHITGNLTASNAPVPAGSSSLPGVDGAYTRNGTLPPVPDWVDFAYVASNWVDSSGNPYTPYTPTPNGSGVCELTPSVLAAASANRPSARAAYNAPVIIDGLGCSGGVTATGTVNLTTSVAVFAPEYNFNNNVGFKSSTTEQRQLWFITPDNTPNGLPTCGTGQGDFTINNSFDIDQVNTAVMVYTPCRFVAKNSFKWRGQMYANGANDFKNNTGFVFVGLGLPGVDLNTGVTTPGGSVGSAAQFKEMLTMRDRAGG